MPAAVASSKCFFGLSELLTDFLDGLRSSFFAPSNLLRSVASTWSASMR